MLTYYVKKYPATIIDAQRECLLTPNVHRAACLTISTVDVILSISRIFSNLRRRERVKFY